MPGVQKDFLSQHVEIFLRNITYPWMDCWNLLLWQEDMMCAIWESSGICMNLLVLFLRIGLAPIQGAYWTCQSPEQEIRTYQHLYKNSGISKVKGDGIMRSQVQAWEWTINIMSKTNKRDSQLDLEDRYWQVNSIQQGAKQKCIDLWASIHVDKGLSEATQSLLCKDTRLSWNWNKLIIRTWAGY